MKKITTLLIFLLILSNLNASAQVLYGSLSNGGNGFGTYYKYDVGNNTFTNVSKIGNGYPIEGVQWDFIDGGNGRLYNFCTNGGLYSNGAIFSYDPADDSIHMEHHFNPASNGPTGMNAPLLKASNGKLYGTTTSGGNGGAGTIFEFNVSTKAFTVLFHFSTGTGFGSAPVQQLFQHSNGKIYGSTYSGGVNSNGVIFEFDPSNNAYTEIYQLTTAGSGLYKPFVEGPTNILYFTCNSGGTNSKGGIGSFNIATNTLTILKEYDNYCYTNLFYVSASNKLYGAYNDGGANSNGTIFEFFLTNNTLTNLFDFDYNTSGSSPKGGLYSYSSNSFYGFTSYGGTDGQGTFYEFNFNTNTHTTLYNFSYNDGGSIGACPVKMGSKYYGCTYQGSTVNKGALYSWDNTNSSVNVIHPFSYSTFGSKPKGGLTLASNGIFYGLTGEGGTAGYGTVLRLDPSTNAVTKLFDLPEYAGPDNQLIEASNGKLYTAIKSGGNDNRGRIYEINPFTELAATKAHFTDAQGGSHTGNLMQASNGLIYGMSNYYGGNNKGTIYHFNINNNTITKKIDLSTALGARPEGGLVEGSNGKMYGVTYNGGVNDAGTLIEFDTTTNIVTVLHSFNSSINTDGANPRGTPILIGNKLYGITQYGGTTGDGTLFEYNIGNNTMTFQKNFLASEGSSPVGGLMLASNNKLYGTLINGGTHGQGSLFEFDPGNNSFTIKHAFQGGELGGAPHNTTLVEYCVASAPTVTVNTSNLSATSSLSSYRWFDCANDSVVFNSKTTNNFTPSNDGDYRVTIRNSSNCIATSDCETFTAPISSIAEASESSVIFTYPNPTSDIIDINIKNSIVTTNAALYNGLGSLIQSIQLNEENHATISLEGIPSGIYILKMEDENHRLYTQKVIKK